MIYLIMGVSCAGKTTIGVELAALLDANFLDADSFHSNANISKMRSGIPLNDEDRKPWLLNLNDELMQSEKNEENTVIACSALKETYRELLLQDISNYLIIYLKVNIKILNIRQLKRKHHFFNASLLSTQISILEPPKKRCITLDANQPKESLIQEIISRISANER